MDILFFEPVYKDYIWGGERLKKDLNKNSPYNRTAESWEISANKNGKSFIKNGKYKGYDLESLFAKQEERKELFGTKTIGMDAFPILIKFIDACNNLSVQVHPDDDYARKNENNLSGKCEMWYVMDCADDAKLICGAKNIENKSELKDILNNGQLKEHLNYMDIKKGNSVFINSGTLHAIMENTLICEIQQNADLTYRVYDWDRVGNDGKPRPLHIDKATDVIDVNSHPTLKCAQDIEVQNLTDCKYFSTDKLNIKHTFFDTTDGTSFYAMNVVEGNGKIDGIDIKKGDSFIIPAEYGKYEIRGEITILKTKV